MQAVLAGLLLALEGVTPPAPAPPAICPTGPQLDAELERLGESATVDRLGRSEVTIAGGTMRIALHDRTGATLGVREVADPVECAKRVSVAAVLLAAWAKSWNETALAPLPRPAADQPPAREAEIGIAVGGTADGDARAAAGGLLADLQIHGAFGAALAAEVAGQRQVALGPGAATYSVWRLGAGLTLRAQPGLAWTEVAILPQLTRVSVEGANLTTTRGATVWGASVQGRARAGLRWRWLAPFVSVTVTRALVREKLILDDTADSARLSSWDVGVAMGASWIFGGQRETERPEPSPDGKT